MRVRIAGVAAAALLASAACDSRKAPEAPAGEPASADVGAQGARSEPEGGAVALDASGQKVVNVMRFEQGRVLGDGRVGLTALAGDADPVVRARVALAIGRVGDAGGLEALGKLVADKEAPVRAQAAFGLALLAAEAGKDKAALAKARGLILAAWEAEREGDEAVRVALAWALRKVGGEGAEGVSKALHEALRDDALAVQGEAMRSFALLARFEPLTPGLKSDEVIQRLRMRAADTDTALRGPATYALMRLADAAHAPELRQTAEQRRPEGERADAIRGLTAMKVFEIGLMRAALLPPPDSTEENPEPVDLRGDAMTQVEAVRHLARAGDDKAMVLTAAVVDDFLPTLAEHGNDLNAPRFHVFLTLVEGLPGFADKARAKALLEKIHAATLEGKALTREDASRGERLNAALLRCAAAKGLDVLSGALGKTPGCGKGALSPLAQRATEIEAAMALETPALDKVRWLQERYADSDDKGKIALVSAAAELVPKDEAAPKDAKGKPEVVKKAEVKGPDPLAQELEKMARAAVKEGDPILRGLGLTLAGDLGFEGAAALVRAALGARASDKAPGDSLDEVLGGLDALGKLNDAESVELLTSWTANPAPVVRRRAIEALRAIDEKAAPATLVPALADPHPEWVSPKPVSVVLRTTRGNMTIALRPDLAPATVDSFLTLSRKGFYNGLTFHRVIANFVAQGGDPRGDGNGGPGYTLPSEWSMTPYKVGTVGMAHAGKDTEGSQFFITHTSHPHLDGGYTVFGEVTEGLEAVLLLQPGDQITGVEFVDPP